MLLDDAGFRVGEGDKAALVGANGAGKTTLLRLAAGELRPAAGSVVAGGTRALLRQFIGRIRDRTTVAELLASLAPEPLRRARAALIQAEQALAAAQRAEPAGLRYAHALAAWGDAGGYDAKVLWDTCTTAALGLPFDRAAARPLASLSGGEQKRLALGALLRGDADVLLLDEPDNYLDLASTEALEDALAAYQGTVIAATHDRWFMRSLDRFLVFHADQHVTEALEPV